jgi:hypothetical protein
VARGRPGRGRLRWQTLLRDLIVGFVELELVVLDHGAGGFHHDIGHDGDIAVWDLGGLRLRATVPASDVGGRADQVGLSRDGSRLAVIAYPPAAVRNGRDLVDAVVSMFDLRGGEPSSSSFPAPVRITSTAGARTSRSATPRWSRA